MHHSRRPEGSPALYLLLVHVSSEIRSRYLEIFPVAIDSANVNGIPKSLETRNHCCFDLNAVEYGQLERSGGVDNFVKTILHIEDIFKFE